MHGALWNSQIPTHSFFWLCDVLQLYYIVWFALSGLSTGALLVPRIARWLPFSLQWYAQNPLCPRRRARVSKSAAGVTLPQAPSLAG